MEGLSPEASEEEAVEEAPRKWPKRKSAAQGRFQVPPGWPKWKKKCGAYKKGKPNCNLWAVIGMPTCKWHGSGGEKNSQLGQLRYLCWVITGGPKDMPVEYACRIAFAVYAERVFNRPDANPNQQMKAALWLTDILG